MDLVINYVRTLDATVLNALYAEPACSLVMLTALPDHAKHVCIRLAFIQNQIEVDWLMDQFASTSHVSIQNTLDQLGQLHILQETTNAQQQTCTAMTPVFKKSLVQALVLGQAHAAAVSTQPDVSHKHRKRLPELTTYAHERWECLLQFLAVCTEQTIKEVNVFMQEILRHGELVRSRDDGVASRVGDHVPVEITSAGFQFLLMDKAKQLWTYLIHNLSLEQSKGADISRQLISLFKLMFLDSNEPYNSQGLDEELLFRCREIGLIFMRKRKDGWFYVTPLMRLLTGATTWSETMSSGSTTASDGNSNKFIVLETNYRVFAYTDSMLQLSILSTFCDMTYRFGNMAVGSLTRDSVRNALQVGITAEQIISYLNEHMRQFASEQQTSARSDPSRTANNDANGLVPATVADQLRLWEMERNRFTFEESVMYSVFESDYEYQKMVSFVQRQGWLMWNSDSSKVVVVPSHAHEHVKDWFKKNKNKSS